MGLFVSYKKNHLISWITLSYKNYFFDDNEVYGCEFLRKFSQYYFILNEKCLYFRVLVILPLNIASK